VIGDAFGDDAVPELGDNDVARREQVGVGQFRASQLEGFKAAIVEDERQQRAAALNTATCYARGGNAARAQQFLPTAELEPSFAEQIQELKAFMDRQAEAAAPASSGAGARRPIQ